MEPLPWGGSTLASETRELTAARSKLRAIIQARSLVFAAPGQVFTLASGEQSPFYFDMKRVTMESESARMIAKCLLPLLPAGVDQVGGLETGAVPIVVALILQELGPKSGFFVRKTVKPHGLRGKIEGNFDPSRPVIIVDDVTTTGDSVLEAVHAVQAEEGQIAKVIAVVDRGSGGSDRVRKLGLLYDAVFSLKDFDLKRVAKA